MDFFRDKVVVITGSSRGIGRETARLALGWGARVVLNGRNPEALEATFQTLGSPETCLPLVADLVHPEEARTFVGEILATWGRIDVLINNAGLSMRGSFVDLDPVTVRTMVEANFLTAVWTTQAALPALRKTSGRVVFVSSLAGLRGFPGVSLYSASKMALTSLHQSLRAEEGPRGVKSHLVYLAFTENDPEKTVLGADGRPFYHQRSWALTQKRTAEKLLKAVAKGRGTTVLTAKGSLLASAQAHLPWLVDRFVRDSGGKIHAVQRSPGRPS